jgi:hypothetical protein
MKDLRLHMVAVICADTPKSAAKKIQVVNKLLSACITNHT